MKKIYKIEKDVLLINKGKYIEKIYFKEIKKINEYTYELKNAIYDVYVFDIVTKNGQNKEVFVMKKDTGEVEIKVS